MGPPSTHKAKVTFGRGQAALRAAHAGVEEDFPEADSRPTKSVSSVTSELPAVQRAAKLGHRLSKMAEEKPPAAWSKMQEEFDVQKLVWQSVGMLKGKQWIAELEGPRSMIESALQQGTTAAVDEALQKGDPGGDIYSNAMREAMKDVLKQERATEDRHNLAEMLRMAAIPASLMRENTDKKELENLVVACALQDDRLERLVRKTLLLPIPVGLGAPVDGAKKGSGLGLGRAAGARGSNSGSIGPPVLVAAMSATLGAPAASPAPSRRSNFEVTPTISGPYVSLLGLPQPLSGKDTSLGAPLTTKRGSGPPKPRQAPLPPQVQQVDTMKFG